MLPLPGCEATPEVRKIIDEKLESNLLDKMKFSERLAYQRRVLEDLMTRYPRDLEPFVRYSNVDEYEQRSRGVRERPRSLGAVWPLRIIPATHWLS